jgi:hypothetical protein
VSRKLGAVQEKWPDVVSAIPGVNRSDFPRVSVCPSIPADRKLGQQQFYPPRIVCCRQLTRASWSRLFDDYSLRAPANGARKEIVVACEGHSRRPLVRRPIGWPRVVCRVLSGAFHVAARGIFAATPWRVIPGRGALTRAPPRTVARPVRGRSIDRAARQGARPAAGPGPRSRPARRRPVTDGKTGTPVTIMWEG